MINDPGHKKRVQATCDVYGITMTRKRKQLIGDESGKSLELKKHVAVIHSSNKLSLLQRKIANALLFNAYKDLLDKDEHEIHISTLCQLIGYDSNDHKTIKKALINLLSTVLEWNLVDGERLDTEGVWNASSIIADASIDGPLCTYSYSNKMKKLLHRPNVYGRLDMLVQAKFQSSYGLALYENCNRFQDIGKSPWFDIGKFRKLMGVEEGKYKIFRDFKTRVLDKAVEEVNQYSPIMVDPQLRKQNRQVVAIQFLISRADDGVSSFADATLTDVLKDQCGFSKKQMDDAMVSYTEDYIREKMSIIKSSASFKTGKIQNLAKYLLSALSEDYQPVKMSVPEKAAKKSRQKKETNVIEFLDADRQHRNEREIQHLRYQDKQLIGLFNDIGNAEKNKLLKEFEKYLNTMVRGIYHDIYLREGIENPLIQDQLSNFLRRMKPDLLAKIPSYEEWVKEEGNNVKWV